MSNERFNINVQALKKIDFKLLYISTSKYEGDWQSLPHTHHFAELFYVVNGHGNFLVENKVITVKEHDLIIVNPNIPHTEMSLNAKPLEYVVFGVEGLTFDFGNSDTPESFGAFSDLPYKNIFLNFFHILLQEISEKKNGYELVCHDILEVVLVFLARSSKIQVRSVSAQKLTKECAHAKRYLDLNYHQSITLDSLAELTHTNKYYLAHSFASYMGMSPINYLIQRRLLVSKELLTSTDHSIAQVASSAGFSSQSYFSQIFKKHTGQTPQQYRKSAVLEQGEPNEST